MNWRGPNFRHAAMIPPNLNLQVRRLAGDLLDHFDHVARLCRFGLFQDASPKAENLKRRHGDTTSDIEKAVPA